MHTIYQTNVIKPSDALILLAMAFCNISTCKKLIKSLPMVIIKANNIKTNNIDPIPVNNCFRLELDESLVVVLLESLLY